MYWVYDLPNWLFGVLTVTVFVLFGLVGMVVTRRWVPSLHHVEKTYNDIVGFYFGSLTVLYGISLGLLLVGVWTNFTEAEAKVDREASLLASLYRDVKKYPEPTSSQLRDILRSYAQNVVHVAWPLQKKGVIPMPRNLDRIQEYLADFEPKTEGQKILHAECLRTYNDLVEARSSRVFSATSGLPRSLWILLLIGAAMNIAVTWFFHLGNRKMHVVMTVFTSALLGLMIFLVAAMDHPFRGELSVSPDAFDLVYQQLMKPGDFTTLRDR